jgi:hypothetical protein
MEKGGGLSITDRRIRMTPNGKGGDPQSQTDAGGLMEKGGGPSIADRRSVLNGKGGASQTGPNRKGQGIAD